MNKLLIVLLAVCLVSVHAFVKREAQEKNENYLENLQKQVQDLTQQFNSKVKDAFDPEQMKKGFNDAIDGLNKALNELKSKTSSPPKE